MDLSTAEAKARILTAEKGVNHVVYEVNNILYVATEDDFIGNPVKVVKYEAPIEKSSAKNKSKAFQNIPDVPGTPDTEVLQNN